MDQDKKKSDKIIWLTFLLVGDKKRSVPGLKIQQRLGRKVKMYCKSIIGFKFPKVPIPVVFAQCFWASHNNYINYVMLIIENVSSFRLNHEACRGWCRLWQAGQGSTCSQHLEVLADPHSGTRANSPLSPAHQVRRFVLSHHCQNNLHLLFNNLNRWYHYYHLHHHDHHVHHDHHQLSYHKHHDYHHRHHHPPHHRHRYYHVITITVISSSY